MPLAPRAPPASGAGRAPVRWPLCVNFRLFCFLERTPPGLPTAALVVITGLWKPVRKAFRDQDYAGVRATGDEYLSSVPRRVAW